MSSHKRGQLALFDVCILAQCMMEQARELPIPYGHFKERQRLWPQSLVKGRCPTFSYV